MYNVKSIHCVREFLRSAFTSGVRASTSAGSNARASRAHANGATITTKRLRARRGITLFEAVAAVAIVGVTAAAALSAVGSQFRTTTRAERALVVEALATSRLDFLDLLNTYQQMQAVPDSIAKGQFPKPMDEYSWTTDVQPVSEEAGLYTVLVTVNWKEGSYKLKSRLYRSPPVVAR